MDPELLERLMVEHAAALQLFAAQWTDLAEDCVQEAFVQLVRQPELPQHVVAWLYRVVRNRAISLGRAARRRRHHEAQAAEMSNAWFAPSPQDVLDAQRLTEALELLEEKHREVIVARIWGGLPFEQIAQVIGASTSSAHRRYEAGLSLLRERLGLAWLSNNDPTK